MELLKIIAVIIGIFLYVNMMSLDILRYLESSYLNKAWKIGATIIIGGILGWWTWIMADWFAQMYISVI